MGALMLDPWISALSFLIFAALMPLSVLLGATLLRVKVREQPPAKFESYECGERPDGDAWLRFHPRYYLVALVFVLFDVEVAFLFPWALNVHGLGGFALIEMFVFLGILLLGWLYALRKGAIKWQ